MDYIVSKPLVLIRLVNFGQVWPSRIEFRGTLSSPNLIVESSVERIKARERNYTVAISDGNSEFDSVGKSLPDDEDGDGGQADLCADRVRRP